MIDAISHDFVVIHSTYLVVVAQTDYLFRKLPPYPFEENDMSDNGDLISQLNMLISAKPDSADSLTLKGAIELIDRQSEAIASLEDDLKSREERIETLLILKDGYYSAMAAWRTSKQTGISINDALARANRGIPASPAQA